MDDVNALILCIAVSFSLRTYINVCIRHLNMNEITVSCLRVKGLEQKEV